MRHFSPIFILYMLSFFLCHSTYADQIEKKSSSVAQMYSLASAKIKEGRELKTGMTFDAFSLTDFDGKVWDNESIRGKVTVINVWYSGCGPCLKEMPVISKWKEEFPLVNFLSVNFESKEIMQKIVVQRGFTWTHCPEDRYFTSWVVTDNLEGGYPLTLVLDEDGVLRFFVHGTNTIKQKQVVSAIKNCLGMTEEDGMSAMEDLPWQQLYEQGKYYMEHSNSFRAMQFLEQANQLHSSDTIRRDLAQTYYNRGKFQQSIDLCRSVLYPDTLDADLYLMARSFEKMEKADSALKYQMMVAERNIENYNNLATLCNTLINVSLIDQALLYLNAYCAIDSTNSAINSVKAYALHRADRHKEAIAVYEKLKAEGDDRKTTNYYMGLSCFRVGRMVEAYNLLYRAVEQTDWKDATILSRFGAVETAITLSHVYNADLKEGSPLAKVLDGTTARDRFKKVIEINDQGAEDIETAIELMLPNKDMLFYLYNHIGNSYAAQYQDSKSVIWYQKACEIYSDRFNVYYQMAAAYRRMKDYKREQQNFELYLKYAPKEEDPETIAYAKECIDECKRMLFMKGK